MAGDAAEGTKAPGTDWRANLRTRITGAGDVSAMVAQLPAVAPGLSVLCALALILAAVLPASISVANGALLGSIPGAVRAGMHSAPGHRLLWALAASTGAYALTQSMFPALAALSNSLGRRLNGGLRRRVMAATLAPHGIAHLEDPSLVDLVTEAQGVGTAQFTPGQAVSPLTSMFAVRVGSLVSGLLLTTYHWWFFFAVILPNLAVLRVVTWQFRRSLSGVVDTTEVFRRSGYIRDLALRPAAAKETRVFGLGPWLGTRFRDEWARAMSIARDDRSRHRWVVFAAVMVHGAVTLGAYVVVGYAGVHHQITLGHLTVLLGAVQGVSGVMTINDSWLRVAMGAAAVPRVLALERRVAALPPARGVDGSDLPKRSIRFEGVHFAYPGSERSIYRGLDLEIEAGRSLAVVGRNGAGKTTLVKLLTRLYEPDQGRILVDGLELARLDPGSWQRRVTAIFQDFVRYELPVYDNVELTGPGQAPERERLSAAARRAGALDLVDTLPAGWDTVLSRQYDNGVDLSGGQWQRIALARAMAAEGAGVLVLDEPSANLDVRAEADLYDRFLDLTRGRTTILISHRFSTVRRADRIIVLEDGRVVEDGSHDTLMAAGGRYAEMFSLQAARFQDEADPDALEPDPFDAADRESPAAELEPS